MSGHFKSYFFIAQRAKNVYKLISEVLTLLVTITLPSILKDLFTGGLEIKYVDM